MDNYFIDKNNAGREDLYQHIRTIYDIVESKIMLTVKKPMVYDYWRRTERYAIGEKIYTILINPNLKPFVSMNSSTEKVKYVEDNWIDFVLTTVANVYPKDLVMKQTDSITYDAFYKYSTPAASYEFITTEDIAVQDCVCEYFIRKYPDLNYFYVYDAYKTQERLGYLNIPK